MKSFTYLSITSRLLGYDNLRTAFEFVDHHFRAPIWEMVTTRRSSFGVQDGDTLALRSKAAPVSMNNTQSKKRKDYTASVGSSLRKKRKSFGNDGTDEAIEE